MDIAEKNSYFDDNFKNKNSINIIKSFTCYFYLISLLIGFIEIFTYFSSENMLPSMNFNTLIFSLFIGMVFIFRTSIILVPITAAIFFVFKFLFPEKKPLFCFPSLRFLVWLEVFFLIKISHQSP